MKKTIICSICCTLSMLAGNLPRTIPAFSLERQDPESRSLSNTIYVTEGNQFTITLQGNAGTGYTWYIQELNEDYIALIAKHVLPCRCPGSRTTTIFRFHAAQAGHETLVFEYARPWSWSVAQKQIFKIIINRRPHPILNEKRS